MLAIVGSILLFYACKKENPKQDFVAKPYSLQKSESRTPFEITTIGWLDTFQTNLALAVNNNSLTTTYSFEKMASGVEALINIATVSGQARTVHQSKVTTFQVSVSGTSQPLKEVYNGAYTAYRNHWLSTDTTETYPVVIDVTIESIVGSTLNVRVTSIVGIYNTCLNTHYTNTAACYGEAFEDGEAYYVGAGDEEESLLSVYLLPMCNHACGETPACATPATTAYEQIESRINFNYPINNPPCPSGYALAGYINVTGPIYAQGDPHEFLEEDCDIALQQFAGTCMEDDLLNCAYCSFYEQIGISPFEIPAGKNFISLNLGVNFCYCADFTCDYPAFPIAEYTYGCPVCRSTVVTPG